MLELNTIHHPVGQQAGITLFIARADKLHPLASGNKFYKLQPNFEFAKQQGINHLISFGGAYSNHIHALALSAQKYNFKSTGFIRGEEASFVIPSQTLEDARAAGMKLQFVNRAEYRRRNDQEYLDQIQQLYPDALIIPEGGSSQLAIGGCKQLADEINAIHQADILVSACGTGATFAGLVCGLVENQQAIGYSVLRDESMQERIRALIQKEQSETINNWMLEQADFGGYAKLDRTLLDFIFDWLDQTGILLDPVYTSKMCMRLMQQIEAGEFESGTSICMLHSGGLQGWRGMENKVTKIAGKQGWDRISDHL